VVAEKAASLFPIGDAGIWVIVTDSLYVLDIVREVQGVGLDGYLALAELSGVWV
jgi:hypothetical protein|tara:strand:+ start:11913 stop:12074 length:162 start_codon:yes stop_codon:yes gene_type:complete